MNSILDQVVFDNTVRTYLGVAIILSVTFLLNRYLSRYIAGLLFRLIKNLARGVEKKSFSNLVVAPLQTFVLVLVTITTLEKINFPEFRVEWGSLTINSNFRVHHTTIQRILEAGGVIILILSFIWLLLRVIDFLAMVLERKAGDTYGQNDNQLIVFFKDFLKVIIAIIGLILVLKFGLELNVANLVTGLSLVGAAVALATRESLENLIASFIIFFDKPFATGDLVKVQQVTGVVEKIGLRSTRIRTEQKTFVTVPNKQMVDSILDNLSLRSHRRALTLLEFQSTTGEAQLTSFIDEARLVLERHKPLIESYSVFLADFQKNALVVQLEFFSPAIDVAAFQQLRQQVNLSLVKLMEDRQLRLVQKEGDSSGTRDI